MVNGLKVKIENLRYVRGKLVMGDVDRAGSGGRFDGSITEHDPKLKSVIEKLSSPNEVIGEVTELKSKGLGGRNKTWKLVKLG